jgi:hypothetical protein
VPGTTYLAHLDPAYKHARHYLGFAEGGEKELQHRLRQHEQGQGSRLLAVVKAAGGAWHITRTWPGTTRAFERRLKDGAQVPRYCPDCTPEINAARRQARAAKKEKEQDMAVPYELTERGREAAESVDLQLTEKGEKEADVKTLGDLLEGLQKGDLTRDQVKEAVRDLDVIAWSVPVRQPEVVHDLEMEAG